MRLWEVIAVSVLFLTCLVVCFFMCRLSSGPSVHTILGSKISTIVIVELADLVATVSSSVLGFVLLE